MSELSQQNCAPLKNGATPTTEKEKEKYLKQLPDWDLLEIEGVKRLKRNFSFDDFHQALKFTNQIGEIAEEQDHHPLITLTWGRVVVQWWTHSIGGLHKNDFIMAAKTSQAFENF
jgi:4a-hydroxytetrahydrobiopterin dehydratase